MFMNKYTICAENKLFTLFSLRCKVMYKGFSGNGCLCFDFNMYSGIRSDVIFWSWQSALASLEQVLPQEMPLSGEIGAVLLAGDNSGVPQYAHHLIRALQSTSLAHTSTG